MAANPYRLSLVTTDTAGNTQADPPRPAHLIRVAVPRLNKQEHIERYLKQLAERDYDLNWAEVEETKVLTPKEWNEFMASLMDDRDWLEGKGGAASWAVDKDWRAMTEAEKEQARRTSYLSVIAVVCGGATVYVDPEGYGYARYVAFAADSLPEGKTREELKREADAVEEAGRQARLDARLTDKREALYLDAAETAKMLRGALRQAFPLTTFSVRRSKHATDVSWMDGPTVEQVRGITERFVSRGWDGMEDREYTCGRRILVGRLVNVGGGYVQNQRAISRELKAVVAGRLAKECGVTLPAMDQYGNVCSHELRVPFQWWDHWHRDEAGAKKDLTLQDIEGGILASDSHEGEYFCRLVDKVLGALSLEEAGKVNGLPEYVEGGGE